MPVRSFIEFHVREDAVDAFERAYLENGFLHKAVEAPGFLGGEFLKKSTTPPIYAATALWRTAADYAAWQQNYGEVFSVDALKQLGQHLLKQPEGSALSVLTRVPEE